MDVTTTAPAATEWYMKAIADNTTLVAIYPKMTLGNLYPKLLGLILFGFAFWLYVHTITIANDITPIHMSIITLVITAEDYQLQMH